MHQQTGKEWQWSAWGSDMLRVSFKSITEELQLDSNMRMEKISLTVMRLNGYYIKEYK